MKLKENAGGGLYLNVSLVKKKLLGNAGSDGILF